MAEFENLFEVMAIIQGHLMENATYYGGGAVLMVPVVYFTRKFSIPLILYAIEITIYLGLMHTLVSMLTNFFAWLHNETSMQAVGDKRSSVFWDTPWIYFWHVEDYDPGWIVYMEGVFTLIIVILVIRYRPMKIQKTRQRTEAAKTGEFQPDQYTTRSRAQQLGQKYANFQNQGKGGKGRRR